MTSMSSLFLCGTVFVEVWLVDVGIAEEYSEPVNNPVGVVWTVDQMYFMTCKKKKKKHVTRKSSTQNPGDSSCNRGPRDRRPGVLL